MKSGELATPSFPSWKAEGGGGKLRSFSAAQQVISDQMGGGVLIGTFVNSK